MVLLRRMWPELVQGATDQLVVQRRAPVLLAKDAEEASMPRELPLSRDA